MNGIYGERSMKDSYRLSIRKMFAVVWFAMAVTEVVAQADSPVRIENVQVVARPSPDSIVLRWAPIEAQYWIAANKNGYTIERYTLVRDGKVLATPEKKVLTASPLLPYTEPQWERVIGNNKYVIIAAQALLGETFELDMKQSSTASIVNKVTENEQRFSIALFCADFSVITAKALGLYYVDKEVKKGEKYLYRIASEDPRIKNIRGSIFASPDDVYKLTPPLQFSAEVKNSLVSMKWNQSHHKRIYTTYIVERSEDGKVFRPISDDPVSTLTPLSQEETEFQYANDSLPDMAREYQYRVKGVTPFGESGPPSEAATVKGKKVLTDLPYITSAVSTDNKTVTLTWDFPAGHNTSLDGFLVERSVSPSGTFNKAHEGLLAKEARSFTDLSPKQTNYYRITAQTTEQEMIRSMTYYAQLVDSIPPVAPVDVQGRVDEHGNVTLKWRDNAESDMYGYRIYRAYYTSEEFAQVTSDPVRSAAFNDRVNVASLNEKIHYRVMAIDVNQNHSLLSDVFTLTLPDKIPPVTPVLYPIRSSEDGVALSWMPSSSEDVVKYDLYRKAESQWIRLTSLPTSADTVYRYVDTSLKNGEVRYYTIVAVDDANLESPPTPPVMGQRSKRRIWPAVSVAEPQIDRAGNKVTLRWEYDQPEVKHYQVFRSANDQPLKLHRSVPAKEFSDRMYPGKYSYKIVAVFNDGSRSEMGEGISFTF